MLAIRMQRTGRKGHAMFRIVVQDARRTPTSGNLVAQLGHYDPHSKSCVLDKAKTTFYLEHGARPSPRVISIIKSEKIKLPAWVEEADTRQRAVRHPEKRRSTAPVKTKEPISDQENTQAAEAAIATSPEESAETETPQE